MLTQRAGPDDVNYPALDKAPPVLPAPILTKLSMNRAVAVFPKFSIGYIDCVVDGATGTSPKLFEVGVFWNGRSSSGCTRLLRCFARYQ